MTIYSIYIVYLVDQHAEHDDMPTKTSHGDASFHGKGAGSLPPSHQVCTEMQRLGFRTKHEIDAGNVETPGFVRLPKVHIKISQVPKKYTVYVCIFKYS